MENREKIKEFLKTNKEFFFTQSEIAQEMGIPAWDVVKTISDFKKEGLIIQNG